MQLLLTQLLKIWIVKLPPVSISHNQKTDYFFLHILRNNNKNRKKKQLYVHLSWNENRNKKWVLSLGSRYLKVLLRYSDISYRHKSWNWWGGAEVRRGQTIFSQFSVRMSSETSGGRAKTDLSNIYSPQSHILVGWRQ